jgi:hypothetical protein
LSPSHVGFVGAITKDCLSSVSVRGKLRIGSYDKNAYFTHVTGLAFSCSTFLVIRNENKNSSDEMQMPMGKR